jgi:hypothetical protein
MVTDTTRTSGVGHTPHTFYSAPLWAGDPPPTHVLLIQSIIIPTSFSNGDGKVSGITCTGPYMVATGRPDPVEKGLVSSRGANI